MRATRDLLRRRMHLARTRAELLAHVQHPNSQEHLPAIGQKMAYKANREGGAERCADPAVHKSSAVDRALISSDDARLRDVDLTLLHTATHHDAHTLYLLQTVPGIGQILSLVWLYEIHAINRFPTVQAVVSDGRLVKCAKEAAGKRLATSGTKIGPAHLTWAFSAAAVVCLRDHPPAPQDLARLENNHDQGHALTVLAQKLARAVYDLLKRHLAFAKEQFFQREGRGAEEPGASRDTQGMNRLDALDTFAFIASWNAQARIGRETLSPAL